MSAGHSGETASRTDRLSMNLTWERRRLAGVVMSSELRQDLDLRHRTGAVHDAVAWSTELLYACRTTSVMLPRDKHSAPCRSPRPRPQSTTGAPASSVPRSRQRCVRWLGFRGRKYHSG